MTEILALPFFSEAHRELGASLERWIGDHDFVREPAGEDVDAKCRALVKLLGEAGWLRFAVPAEFGGQDDKLDVRSLCILRENLAYVSGLADFAFAMQGLGAGPISLFGSSDLKRKYLARVASGEAIAAFAISEAEAGSDIAGMSTTAHRDGNSYVINGSKTWISNGGIADFYVTFCKLANARQDSPATGKAEFIALVVEPSDKGFNVAERIETIAPHPLATLSFDACRVSADRVVGDPSKGLRVALGTLDVFRSTVGAAAIGFARRALAEALEFASSRRIFGEMLTEFQMTQGQIADMATDIDASSLLVYRSAWVRDNGGERVTREAAMAKMYATEAAQRVIDRAVQLLGGRGVVSGHPVERLYREIRSLRIYEGTTEVQKLVIAGQVLRNFADARRAPG